MRFHGFRRGNRLVHEDDWRLLPRQGSWEHGAGGGGLGSFAGDLLGLFFCGGNVLHTTVFFLRYIRAREGC